MGGKKISERSIKKKPGPVHPNSRRAFQLARVAHRRNKLTSQKSVRNRQVSAKVNRMVNIILLLPDTTEFLPDLYSVHDFFNTFYLTRNDDEIKTIESERRPGRPACKKESELKDLREREQREYQEGVEIPDLTCETNVKLLREWEGDPNAIPMFKMIRICGKYRDQCTLMHSGNHKLLELEKAKRQNEQTAEASTEPTTVAEDTEMATDIQA